MSWCPLCRSLAELGLWERVRWGLGAAFPAQTEAWHQPTHRGDQRGSAGSTACGSPFRRESCTAIPQATPPAISQAVPLIIPFTIPSATS